MPSGNEVTEMFKKNKLESVYLALAKRYSEATEKKSKEYMNKLKSVQRGYKGVLFAGVSFIVFVLLLILHTWLSN